MVMDGTDETLQLLEAAMDRLGRFRLWAKHLRESRQRQHIAKIRARGAGSG